MKFIFWQNSLSIHQSAHIRALADTGRCEVVLVTQDGLPLRRKAMGWGIPEFGATRTVCAPPPAVIRDMVSTHLGRDSFHIFSGISSYPMVHLAFKHALALGARIGLLSESPNPRGWRGLLRYAKAKIEAFRYLNRIEFILAIGRSGVKWFEDVGYPEDKIYEYGYFTDRPTDNHAGGYGVAPGVRMVFVGECTPGKGVDLLITALGTLRHLSWHLDIVGDGLYRTKLEVLVRDLRLGERISFLGSMPHDRAMPVVATADLLVLPSRYDGWGAVVNEALMRGTPVVCSDSCGAAVLLSDPTRGEVVPTDSIQGLTDTLDRWIRTGPKSLLRSQRIRDWSRAIEGEAAANYLLDIVSTLEGGGPRPTPPWAAVTPLGPMSTGGSKA